MSHLGKYELLRCLGSDSLTEDHLGHRTDANANKKVLIKRLLPELAKDEKLVQIFLDQARRASHLYHPNIIQIHDLGQEGDAPFIVLEYVPGHTLQKVIDQAIHLELPISMGIVSHVIIRICSGLDYAHSLASADNKSLEIIHGGLQPASVLMSPEGDIKLIDFCTAGAMNYLAANSAVLQLEQRAYMSPEQCQGKALDGRSDVFSVGVLLYELACRRRLFRRNTVQATTRAIVMEPFPPPSAVVSDLPDEVENVIMMALSRSPQDRYKTIKLMQVDLEEAFEILGWNIKRDVVAGYLSNLFPESDALADQDGLPPSLPLVPERSMEVIPADLDEVTQREEIFTSIKLPAKEPSATRPPEPKPIPWTNSREETFDSLHPVPALQTGQHTDSPENTDVLPASYADALIGAEHPPSSDVLFSVSEPTLPPDVALTGAAPSPDTPPAGASLAPGGATPAGTARPLDYPTQGAVAGASAADSTAPPEPGGTVAPPPPPASDRPAAALASAQILPGAESPAQDADPLRPGASATVKTDNHLGGAPGTPRRWSMVVVVGLVASLAAAGLIWKLLAEEPPMKVEVLSDPPGASVYLNGQKNFKETPTFLGGVPLGREHSVVLIKKGYEPWMKIYPPGTKLPERIKAELKPTAGARSSLAIKVNVEGAQIYFNGEMRGEAPVLLRGITSGKPHHLVVKKEGYLEVTREIKALQPLEKRNIEILLEPRLRR